MSAAELRLEVGDGVGGGWIGPDRVELHTPGDRLELPVDLLPGALARLVGLGPRPHRAGAEPRRLDAGVLARALAGGDPAAAADLLSTLRQRWRVEARWPGDSRVVEALDTDTGIWLLVPDGADVRLLPVTPTRVFRLLVALSRDAAGARTDRD
jgi:hypothetical protein